MRLWSSALCWNTNIRTNPWNNFGNLQPVSLITRIAILENVFFFNLESGMPNFFETKERIHDKTTIFLYSGLYDVSYPPKEFFTRKCTSTSCISWWDHSEQISNVVAQRLPRSDTCIATLFGPFCFIPSYTGYEQCRQAALTRSSFTSLPACHVPHHRSSHKWCVTDVSPPHWHGTPLISHPPRDGSSELPWPLGPNLDSFVIVCCRTIHLMNRTAISCWKVSSTTWRKCILGRWRLE